MTRMFGPTDARALTKWRFSSKALCSDGFASTRWFWDATRDDGSILECATGFNTLVACEADAKRAGYESEGVIGLKFSDGDLG